MGMGMALQLAPIAAGSAIAAGLILKATEEEALLAGPEYIRDAQPEGLTRRIGLGIARQACRRYADDPTNFAEGVTEKYENACRPYLDLIDYGRGGFLEVPFEGGQCAGVNYRVQGTSTVYPGADCEPIVNAFNGFFNGPIRGLITRVENPTGELCTPGQNRVYLVHGPDGNIDETIVAGAGYGASFEITSVTRNAGGPDVCGNPPPVVTQPEPPDVPGPDEEPIEPTPGREINLNVTLNFDGSINFNMGLAVPILINPFGDSGGDGDGGGGGNDSPPNPEGGPELPGGDGGTGSDDEFGPPPAGRRWVGCCIRITNTPQNASRIPGTAPEDVYPGVVGNIRLVFAAGGIRQTDTPVRILARHVCVWEPVSKLNPTGVSVDLLPGYSYVYKPYSVPLTD